MQELQWWICRQRWPDSALPRTSSADENWVSACSLTIVNDSMSESAVQKHHWAEQDPLLLVTVVKESLQRYIHQLGVPVCEQQFPISELTHKLGSIFSVQLMCSSCQREGRPPRKHLTDLQPRSFFSIAELPEMENYFVYYTHTILIYTVNLYFLKDFFNCKLHSFSLFHQCFCVAHTKG